MAYFLAYVAAMFFVALPVALLGRSILSAVIFSVWSIGQVAYCIGAPEPVTQAVIYAVAFSYCLLMVFAHPDRWSGRCIGAAMFFLPLSVVCWQWMLTPTLDPWWTIYGLAWLQLGFLIRPRQWLANLDRAILKARLKRGDFLMVAA